MQNFVHNEWDKGNAQKRGGGAVHLSLDFRDGEERYLAEPFHELTPEKLYTRARALTQLETALESLRDRYVKRGQAGLFEELEAFLPGACDPPPHRVVADRTGKSEPAIKMAVSRLRREFGTTLREAVGRIVSDGCGGGCGRSSPPACSTQQGGIRFLDPFRSLAFSINPGS